MQDKNDRDEIKYTKAEGRIYWFAASAPVALVAFYAFNYGHLPLVEDPAKLGTFGDFVGGLLNPIFSLFTVFLFLVSLRQNRKALRQGQEALRQGELTLRMNLEELKETRKEVRASAEALALQVEAMNEQRNQQNEQYLRTLYHKAIDTQGEVLYNIMAANVIGILVIPLSKEASLSL